MDALQRVFFCLLQTHFFSIRQLTSVLSVAMILKDPAASVKFTTGRSSFGGDLAFRPLLSSVVRTTIELQNELRVMYLPTAQRCHYMFTLTDLTLVFR